MRTNAKSVVSLALLGWSLFDWPSLLAPIECHYTLRVFAELYEVKEGFQS